MLSPFRIVGHFVGASTKMLAPWKLQGNLQGSTTGNLTIMEKWGRSLQQPAHGFWQTVHTSITTQVVTPTSGFAYLQNQVRAHSDQGTLQEADLLDSDSSTRVLPPL